MRGQMPDSTGLIGLYDVLREHMIWAKLSYGVWGLSLILLIQFVSLLLMSKQSNHYYDEMLRYFSRLESKMKSGRGDR